MEMYDEALDEVQYAERAWGTSTALAATRAWLLNRTGELRPAINLMRQTYPQFLAAGGESMPPEILTVIFPLRVLVAHPAARAPRTSSTRTWWRRSIAQESTFDKDIVSSREGHRADADHADDGPAVGEAARASGASRRGG